ncbi:cob(I)yrinic acid a,c-diamide adenosyltransferase [Pinisolibacter aquiterrae]|jgi:cob(I)alamin adenosyltransferase|uniref:cob(I)yrinic acid a,c-diamide adenosyltransferase n=1 Tax=Pinisolibacter aquiterrae TaxID=2815579 RepID=UPI001C3E50C0|nr:cob(I)yrinic acid a,c-diamide adenosyltransferase [Pinisolibacter aquiterrae]MBV5264737.1 cob(I)yrinic acid a,c-diamide adenosyltransferase [Pinisolibacter aquiterrae]MCC8233506.1 cob(I)yrinic acid a,c-diamide adenosyltransferase [Pinisolibacter aquiterrae]
MVVLNRIYTRKGDDGSTALVTGERLPKSHLRIEAYGTIDETNAVVGMARLHTAEMPDLDAMLARIQNDLFDLGADLATPPDAVLKWEPLRVVASQVERLEQEIDRLNADLEPLKSFVLPGGSAASAHLHLARTVSRRAERIMVGLTETDAGAVGREAVAYVNRLSDFFFVAARWVNDHGRTDVLWVPGAHR